MTIQRLLNFYDTCTISSMNSNQLPLNPSFKASLNDQVNEIDTFWKSQDYVNQKKAEALKQAGNVQLKNGKYKSAIQLYKRSIELKPNYADAYFNLAKAYKNNGDLALSIVTYKDLLKISPNDVEALSNLGNTYKETNVLIEARKYFQKALDIDPKYDAASRSIKEIDHSDLKRNDPVAAAEILDTQSNETLQKAVELVKLYAPPDISENFAYLNVQFGKTNSMSGHANIAQYENDTKSITVTDKYRWAAPEVIAAYLVHEGVHAKDKDPYTSIQEEQDAYRESVKFWLAHNNGVKDQEMDYAASLYLIDPAKLDAKVKEVYSTRDGSIPKYSPNHGLSACALENQNNSGLTKIKNYIGNLLSKQPKLSPQVSSDQGLLCDYCR